MPPHVAAADAPSPAFRVERYAVFNEFAAGGMASVHFAMLCGAHGFRRMVAVKRLLPHLARNHDFVLMLIDEARLAARVSHPNVVPTLEAVQSEREVLLVMEYIHGESLAKLSRWARDRGERIPVPIACAIVADALHGLHAAHEAKNERGEPLGLVHRDVSPQNILVGLDGVPRVADFGVAKAAGRSQTTRDGILKGKLAYMAPEQLSSGDTSRTSDVFSAAVVLWEALTGQRLFEGKNHAETAFKILSAPIPPASTRNPAVTPALDAVLLRGLAREPAQRYATAREMALAIERSASGVRPSDLAHWVEQVVGDRLDARLSMLRAIERGGDVDTSAETAVRARQPHVSREPVIETGTPPRKPRYVAWAVLLGVAALATAAALQLMASPPQARVPPAPLPPQPIEVHATSGELSAGHPSVEPPPTTSNAAAAVRTKPVPRARTRRARPTPHDDSPDCDPPFTIDSNGHRVFKAACM